MKLLRLCMTIAVVGLIGSLASCGSKDPAPAATVKFSIASVSYAEDVGTVNVQVTLSKVVTSPVTVNYTWTSPDTTAILGADFTFVSPGSIVIPAGATTATIGIDVIDDLIVDGTGTLTLTLKSATNATVSATAADQNFTLTITDNDVYDESSRLQVDLIWFPNNSVTADVNTVDLNLLMMENVVHHDSLKTNGDYVGQILDDQGDIYTSSENTAAWESLFLDSDAPDQEYFVYVVYAGGSGAATFVTIFDGLGYSDAAGTTFAATEAPNTSGMSFRYLGPFTKSGDTFTFTGHTGRATSIRPFAFSDGGFYKRK